MIDKSKTELRIDVGDDVLIVIFLLYCSKGKNIFLNILVWQLSKLCTLYSYSWNKANVIYLIEIYWSMLYIWIYLGLEKQSTSWLICFLSKISLVGLAQLTEFRELVLLEIKLVGAWPNSCILNGKISKLLKN